FFDAFPSGVDGTVELFWSPASDDIEVVAYEIYEDGSFIHEAAGTDDSAFLIDIAMGGHRFEIQALDAEGHRSPTLSVATVLEITAPTWPPGIFSAAGPSGLLNLVRVSWTPATDDVAVAEYRVLFQGRVVASALGDELSADAFLLNVASATFEVQAVDANGN